MPRPVTMPIANDKRRRPERTEAIRILKPAISNIPKSVSAMVAAHSNDTVNELGKRDVTAPVYSTKRAKFPQDTFFAPYGPHKPKRSATADRKEAPSANRANRRTISVPFSLSCAAFEFIHLHVRNAALFFNTCFLFSVRSRNSCINDPIRSTSSSNAKWPVSRRWISALGISLLKSSAPSTVKIPSFLPHVTSVGG